MKRLLVLAVFICSTSALSAGAQEMGSDILAHVTLFSPWVFIDGVKKPGWDKSRAAQSCLDVRTLKYGKCPITDAIGYGNRFGDNIDIFSLEIGRNSQTRIIDLGQHEWNEDFEVPYVRPYPMLREGESRKIIVNTSGNRAPDGNTFGKSTVANQVKTARKNNEGEFADNYAPYLPAKLGHIYIVRVLDSSNDYYFLLHVDRIDSGSSVDLSFKKIPSPKAPIF